MQDVSKVSDEARGILTITLMHSLKQTFRTQTSQLGLMTTELAAITFSFEAGFAPQPPGFLHSPRYTYGQCVCTRSKRKIVYPEPWSHTSHVHGPVHVAIEARVSATKVCHRGILLCHFLMRGLLGVPDLVGLETMAQCEVPLKRKRLSATLVGLTLSV